MISTKRLILLFSLTLSLMMGFAPAFAQDSKSQIQCGVNQAAGTTGCTPDSGAPKTLGDTIKTIINILSAAVGVIAVIMIIVGGLRFVTSGGNAEAVKSARSTLLYAVIGLVVVALAQVIVHYVLFQTKTATTSSATSFAAISLRAADIPH